MRLLTQIGPDLPSPDLLLPRTNIFSMQVDKDFSLRNAAARVSIGHDALDWTRRCGDAGFIDRANGARGCAGSVG